MSRELDKLREVFLNDVDEETRQDNADKIQEWETALNENRAMASWQSHDITKLVAERARTSYVDIAITLANNRTLTEQQKFELWAKQDAMLWLITTCSSDAIEQLKKIEKEIRTALATATN